MQDKVVSPPKQNKKKRFFDRFLMYARQDSNL